MTESSVDVSVVIPTFRRPALVAGAVRSALAQEGVSVEVHVVDDSPEGSARDAVLAIEDPRVRYSLRERPSGGCPSVVRNDGAREARGRYLQFLDDDDILLPGAYRTHVDALDAQPERGMSFGRLAAFGADAALVAREQAFWDGAARRARRMRHLGTTGLVAVLLFNDPMFANSACMVRRSVFEAVGGFDPALEVQEDTELHVRTTRHSGAIFLDRDVVRYRVTPNSLIHDPSVGPKLRYSYAHFQRTYRDRHGAAEFWSLKVLSRASRPWLE